MTVPESWVKYTQENLSRSQHERELSARLRGAVDACIRASANEMWAQHNTVNNALNARVQQLEGAKEGLQAHLQKVWCTVRVRHIRNLGYSIFHNFFVHYYTCIWLGVDVWLGGVVVAHLQ